MEKDSKKRLFEVMARLDKTFKPSLNEWNFDKKKGEGKEEEGKESKEHEEKEEKDSGKKKWNFEKKEDKESEKHEESETPEEEKEEHEEKEELDEVKPKIPVNAIAKVGGKKVNERYSYDDDEDDPDAGHTVNGKPLTPEEYRKWKEEEGEYDDMDRERYPKRYEEGRNMEEEIISEESGNSPINKFVMFGFNFPPDFIKAVWADNENLANHLQGKFSSIYDRDGAKAAVFVFYTELDSGNKRKFEDWVTQNYNG